MSSSSAGGAADNQMEALTNKLSQFSLRKKKKRRRKKKAVVPSRKAEPKQQLVRSLRLWDDQGPCLTRWDTSARTLLNITLTFLRHAPEVKRPSMSFFKNSIIKVILLLAGRQPSQKSWHCFKAVRPNVSRGRGLVPIS